MSDASPCVVIVGAGFAGLSAALKLAKAGVEVVVIDRRNHHLFQPLLYQVATAGLSPGQIAVPIRGVLSGMRNCEVLLGEVTAVDREKRRVKIGERWIAYDELIVATGATTSYFGHDEWERFAPSLKTVEDATELRRRILLAFERAESCEDVEQQKELLHFVVVGGGPTGVEMAGAIAELARVTLSQDFHRIDPTTAKVTLIEGGERLLAAFDPRLSKDVKEKLEKMGVQVLLGERVTLISDEKVVTSKREIRARFAMWAAGVRAEPMAEKLGVEADRSGRIPVTVFLNLKEDPHVFVLGDQSLAIDTATGNPLPGLAPVAMQQGRYVAHLIIKRTKGLTGEERPFRYVDKGSMATVGRSYAVAEIAGVRFRGFVAWVLWCVVHIMYLIGFRNRTLVVMDWLWSYVTYQKGSRLIVGRAPGGP